MKLDLLTNATVVDDAIRFVSGHYSNNKRLISEGEKSSEESKEEPDYNEENTDKHGEEKQEEETGELTERQKLDQQTTINQVF